MLVPVDNQYVAMETLETQLEVGTANNTINSVRTSAAVPEGYVVNHFLTDPTFWGLTTDVPEGFKYFNRIPISDDSDGDFDTGNLRWKTRERYAFGVSDYLAMWASQGT